MSNTAEHHFSKDGSSTLYSNQFGQFYHNPNGAISESKYVFFDASGLTRALDTTTDELTIFEIGFGTGLNFLLLFDQYISKNLSFPIHFYSVEAFPVNEETASKFNFSNFLEHQELSEILPNIFRQIQPGKNTFQPLSNRNVHLHLYYCTFEEIDAIDHNVNFILQDAFSPEVNQELWSINTFKKLASFCTEDAILSTYCAASKARAAMAKAGWLIARAPGALGKREMTIASFSEEKLIHLKRVNEQRLIERLDSGEFEESDD